MNIWTMQQLCKASIVLFFFVTGAQFVSAQDEPDVARLEICEGGIIRDVTVGSINMNGVSCYFSNVTVENNLIVTNAGKVTIQNSDVGGAIRLGANGEVDINDTNAGSILVQGNDRVEISLVTADKQLRVYRNASAFIIANASPTIDCSGNIRLVAFKNESSSGNNCSILQPFWDE